jgi:FeS assembly protein IscX
MNDFSQSGQLNWDATYEIVLSLKEAHPNIDIDSLGLEQLFQYIVTLPNFADDPAVANEGILTEILREWYEEENA